MKIWLVSRPLDAVGYDEHREMVVSAPSPSRARELASYEARDEGPQVWRTPLGATVKLIASAPAEAFLNEQVICIDGKDG
jgi:hypothetical protein